MRNITFIGQVESSYFLGRGRGKDKTKRKRKLLNIAGSAGIIYSGAKTGQAIGEKLGTRKIISKIEAIKNKSWDESTLNDIKRKGRLHKPKVIKLLNKANKIGGLKGAVVGGGLASASLGAAYLYNKMKSRKKK